MKEWNVTVPIVGYAIVLVEAIDEGTAISEALRNVSFNDVESWEGVKVLAEGNVLHAPRNRAEAEEAFGND
jgi:hypothetical protein